ncbi:hypothetical protein GVAV_000060 [Gurleya vavrai]
MEDFFIVNKAGCLIFSCKSDQTNANIILSSSIVTIYAHLMEIPLFVSLEENSVLFIKCENKSLTVYKTFTEYVFIFINEKIVDHNTCQKIALVFCDYVLKNPFYQLEMPINCDKFRCKINDII